MALTNEYNEKNIESTLELKVALLTQLFGGELNLQLVQHHGLENWYYCKQNLIVKQ
jgi:hypothetical protein